MAPRFVVGHLHNDAVAGSVALFRGPLLYVLEQQDQAPGTDIEQLGVLPDQPVRPAPTPATLSALPSGDLPALAWANRATGPMRVCIPALPATT